MKRWLLLVLLSLMLCPSIAEAQPTPATEAGPSSPPASATTTLPKGTGAEQPLLIPLQGTDQIQLKLVNCDAKSLWGIDCGLSQLLLPASTRLDQWDLQFENPASRKVKILTTAVTANGTLNSYQLTTQEAVKIPSGPQSLPAQPIVSLSLSLKRSAMPPNQYGGAVYLTLDGQNNRLLLPLDLRIRTGPTLPLLVVLLGIILGRLFKYMQEQGGPQAQSRKALYQLEADIKDAHADDQKLLAGMVQATRKLVYRQQIEAANTQVAVIRSRLDVLTQLRSLETRLNERKKNSELVPEETFEQIRQVRTEIEQGLDAKAKETLDQVIEALNSLAARRAGADVSEQIESTLRGAVANLDQNARSLAIAPRQPTWMDQVQRTLIDLSGLSDLVRTEATYWFVRPFLYGVLLVGLTIVGLNTLYIEKGETFGARPLSDYLGLILWGLSADVASRSLSSLQGQKE